MAALFVWFAGTVSALSHWFSNTGTVLLVVAVGWMIIHTMLDSPYYEKAPPYKTKPFKWVLSCGIACSFISAVLPSEKTTYWMAGAYVGQTVVQSEVGDKVGKLLNQKLDEYLTEVSENVTKKEK